MCTFWEHDSCYFSKYYVLLEFIILFKVLEHSFSSFEVKCETLFAFRVSCIGPINQCIFSCSLEFIKIFYLIKIRAIY